MRKLPAYVSWDSFTRVLDAFGPRAPGRINNENFVGLPASTISQMLQAFRFLGLVGASGAATSDLRLLIEQPDSRQATIAKILRQSYPDILHTGAEPRALAVEEFVSHSGLQPATQRKAIKFFLNAAAYADIRVVAGTPESGSPQPSSAAAPPARSMRVPLRSGGTVEVKLEFDPFRISVEDRDFVFQLVDQLRQYEKSPSPAESDSEPLVANPHASLENEVAPF